MRSLELLIVIASFSYLVWLTFGNGLPHWMFQWLPFAAGLLVLIHVWLEGYRLVMLPAYVVAALLLVFHPWCQAQHFRIRLTYMAIAWVITSLLLGVCVLAAGIRYPVFEFEPLTGPYAVGTLSRHLIDRQRMDPYAAMAGVPRELMIQIWYPAARTDGYPRARYRDGLASNWRDASMSLVKTRSYTGAPFASNNPSYPVLIFTGPINRFGNTFETEELASHGFVVVAVDHPYDSNEVAFPDGRIIRIRKPNTFLDFTSDDTFRKTTEEVEFDLGVRVADVECALDRLSQPGASGENDLLTSRLDFSKIGIFGHSFGGAAAAEICRRDSRVKAGINMDGWMFGEARTKGVPKPFFFMGDCTPDATEADLTSPDPDKKRLAKRIHDGYEEVKSSLGLHGGYCLQVPGFEHMNFSDAVLFSQIKGKTGAGKIDRRKAHQIVNRFSLAFFRKHLLGEPVSLRSIASDYPGMTFLETPLSPTNGNTAFLAANE